MTTQSIGANQLPIALAALFEPNGRFKRRKALTGPDILFNYSEDVNPVVIEKSSDELVTLYKDKDLGTSEIVLKEHIQKVWVHNSEDKSPLKLKELVKNST